MAVGCGELFNFEQGWSGRGPNYDRHYYSTIPMVLDQWCCILSNKYKDDIEKKEY